MSANTGVAPTLKTQAAKSDAALVRQMIDALNEKIVKIELDNKPLTLQDMISKKRR